MHQCEGDGVEEVHQVADSALGEVVGERHENQEGEMALRSCIRR